MGYENLQNQVCFPTKKAVNSVIQPHLDYGPVVWVGQATKEQKLLSEGPLRTLTRSAWGLEKYNYWERLQEFRLSSKERRMDHYAVIYIWKSLNGKVLSLNLEWAQA